MAYFCMGIIHTSQYIVICNGHMTLNVYVRGYSMSSSWQFYTLSLHGYVLVLTYYHSWKKNTMQFRIYRKWSQCKVTDQQSNWLKTMIIARHNIIWQCSASYQWSFGGVMGVKRAVALAYPQFLPLSMKYVTNWPLSHSKQKMDQRSKVNYYYCVEGER